MAFMSAPENFVPTTTVPEQQPASASTSTNLHIRTLRPALFKSDQINLCAFLGNHVKVLWPSVDILSQESSHKLSINVTQDLIHLSVAKKQLWDERVLDINKEKTLSDDQRTHFWMLQKQLNNVSVKALTYEEACIILGLNHENLYWELSAERQINELTYKDNELNLKSVWKDGTFKSYSWQIIAVAWLMHLEVSIVEEAILSDKMGPSSPAKLPAYRPVYPLWAGGNGVAVKAHKSASSLTKTYASYCIYNKCDDAWEFKVRDGAITTIDVPPQHFKLSDWWIHVITKIGFQSWGSVLCILC